LNISDHTTAGNAFKLFLLIALCPVKSWKLHGECCASL